MSTIQDDIAETTKYAVHTRAHNALTIYLGSHPRRITQNEFDSARTVIYAFILDAVKYRKIALDDARLLAHSADVQDLVRATLGDPKE